VPAITLEVARVESRNAVQAVIENRLVIPLPIPISDMRSRSQSICTLPYAVAIISACIVDWAITLCFFNFQMTRDLRA